MTKEKILEAATSLLISKIQFDARFEIVNRVIQYEEWERLEEVKTSLNRGIELSEKMQTKLVEIKNIIDG